ncbi:hypothetical protein ACFL0H_06010 [Thermodesulfobacteriota bacterium]
MEKSLMQKIREVVNDLDDFDIDHLTVALHVQTYEGREKIRRAVKGLKKLKEVETIRPGLYRYKGKQGPLSLIAKMWRAIRIKERFTLRDIVRLSGASKTHAHKYFKYLEGKGIIANCSGDRRYSDGLNNLVDPDNAPLDHPKMPLKNRKNGKHSKTT